MQSFPMCRHAHLHNSTSPLNMPPIRITAWRDSPLAASYTLLGIEDPLVHELPQTTHRGGEGTFAESHSVHDSTLLLWTGLDWTGGVRLIFLLHHSLTAHLSCSLTAPRQCSSPASPPFSIVGGNRISTTSGPSASRHAVLSRTLGTRDKHYQQFPQRTG